MADSVLALFCHTDDFCPPFAPGWQQRLLAHGVVHRRRQHRFSSLPSSSRLDHADVITHGFSGARNGRTGGPIRLTKVAKTLRWWSLAVAMTVASAAYACAPHSDRKPLVTLR
jgi:hypothetical protein